MMLVKQDDKQIDCTFCDEKAEVWAELDGNPGWRRVLLVCEPCNFKTELDRKYWGQIETRKPQ
jgi:C4-type Zn-finger protein